MTLLFCVSRGEVVGFLGPNGAGKTTTLRILAGFVGATTGRVRILGEDITDNALKARTAVGYMPEASPLYPELRVGEYLRFRAELNGRPAVSGAKPCSAHSRKRTSKTSQRFSLATCRRGIASASGLADALVASPPIPRSSTSTAGLDPIESATYAR